MLPTDLEMAESNSALQEVSLSGLLTKDSFHIATLLEACCTDGCFYLTLEGLDASHPESGIFDMAEEIIKFSDEFFELPVEEKLIWEMDKWGDMQIAGVLGTRYKPAGKHSGVVEGKRDGFENFLVPLNAILHLDSKYPHWPPPIHAHLPLLGAFELICQKIVRKLLGILSGAISPKPSTPFEDLHREQEPSTTSLAILKYLPSVALPQHQIGHMAHTDVGSLTLLFTCSPGLQMLKSSTHSWLSVTPRPGRIVVNVGDSLSFMSGQRLKSCVHRVIPCGKQSGASESRRALAYFQRPELSAHFFDGDGREWTGEDWHKTKYKIFRANNDEQRETSLLTGRSGFLGGWN